MSQRDEPATPDLSHLTTELSNSSLDDLDSLSIIERLRLMNQQDMIVAAAVEKELPEIARAVDAIVRSFELGGRLIYVGAGTSGRLGMLDAAECPPTFSVDPNMVIAIIAGGKEAMFNAVEGAEDDRFAGERAIADNAVNDRDTVVGISASGQAPFVIGALAEAAKLGAVTVSLTNNRPSALEAVAQISIAPIVGPEFIGGSTRLKSGTSQKMVLNMLSTNAMIGIGKTYGNRMVDVKASNSKLKARALRLTMEITNVTSEQASQALEDAHGSVKLAVLMIETGLSSTEARELLVKHKGVLRTALGTFGNV